MKFNISWEQFKVFFFVVCFDFHNIWYVVVSVVIKFILIKKKQNTVF